MLLAGALASKHAAASQMRTHADLPAANRCVREFCLRQIFMLLAGALASKHTAASQMRTHADLPAANRCVRIGPGAPTETAVTVWRLFLLAPPAGIEPTTNP